MAEVDELRNDLERLRSGVNEQFDAMRGDIKELTAALRELIRIDGDIKRVQDALIRIGREVDDHEERVRKLEERIGKIESKGAVNEVRLGNGERIIWLIILGAVNLLQYFLTHWGTHE